MNHFAKAIQLLDDATEAVESLACYSHQDSQKHAIARLLLKAALHIEMARDQRFIPTEEPTNGVVPVHDHD